MATYDPSIFDVSSIEHAKQIILTTEGSSTTEERWKTETPYLSDLIVRRLPVAREAVVVDYGCGIGRVAKELIERTGCQVVGADITQNMRTLASHYVQSSRFLACAPEMLGSMIRRGFCFEAALCVWVLQHCLRPADDLDLLRSGLVEGGRLFVLNMVRRVVPAKERPWIDDGLDMRGLLSERFTLLEEGTLPENVIARMEIGHFWACYARSR
jgi:SAM-dependent methyltransferase